MKRVNGSQTEKRMACAPCTKTKRKCDKQVPGCRRCIVKGVACRYPARRITPAYEIVYAQDGTVSTITASVKNNPSTLSSASFSSPSSPPDTLQDNTSSLHHLLNYSQYHLSTSSPVLSNPWFLSPSSWIIDHNLSGIPGTITFGDQALFYFIDKLLVWFKQWTTNGHCPLFHSKLYSSDLPLCVQDAFAALVAYQNRTPATEKLVMRLIERRANHLLQDQPLEDQHDGLSVVMHETSAHLARTQALLVYKVIRLFDGDIRSRAEAESHISVLSLWASEMWQSAAVDVSISETDADTLPPLQVAPKEYQKLDTAIAAEVWHTVDGNKQLRARKGDILSTWEAWVLAESIRRTYLIATLVEGVYLTLKQGWAPCRGGIIYSGGRGLWDAPSAFTWLDQVRSSQIFRVRNSEASKLFYEAKPSDVDEFSHVTLIVSYGLERFEQWTVERGDQGVLS